MTDDEIAAMKARAAAATPGPWEAQRGYLGPKVRIAQEYAFEAEVNSQVWDCDDPQDGCMDEQAQWMADAEFIAHARADIPALLAERAALRAENAALREALRTLVEPELSVDGVRLSDKRLYGVGIPLDAVTKARALLAGEGGDAGAGEEW